MKERLSILMMVALFLFSCTTKQKVAVTSTSQVSSTPAKASVTKVFNPTSRLFDYYFYEALRLKENQELDQAIETFQLCLSIDSVDACVHSELGLLYYSIGMKDVAVRHLEKSIKIDPSNWWYNVRIISIYSEMKNTTRAIVIAKKLETYYPNKEEVYSMEASLYKDAREFDHAIDAFNHLESLVGVDESIAMEKFQLYILIGKYKKAIAEVDKLVAKYPSQTQYRVLRGEIYMQQRMPEQAYATYQKVLADDPQNANVYLALSEYYNEMKEPEKAMQSIVKALENDQLDITTKVAVLGQYVEKFLQDSTKLDQTESLFKLLVDRYPMDEQVHGYYALFLQYRNRNDEAISELETMLNINSKNQQTWLKLIQVYIGSKNYQAIIETSAKAMLEMPAVPAWYFYKGIAHYQLNDFDSALSSYKLGLPYIAIKDKEVMGDFYAQIADVYYKLNNKDSAFTYYDKALEVNPKNLMVMNNYAYYLSLENKELKKAERMSAKTVELDPKNSTFLDTYAWILYQQGNYSLARFYIERAVDNLPKNDESGVVYEHCGDIFWKYGVDNDSYQLKALEMWKKALEMGNSSEELKSKIENKGMKK